MYNNAGADSFTYTIDIDAIRPVVESHNDTLYGLTEKTDPLSLGVGTAQTFFKSMNLKANTKIFLSVNSEDGAIGSNAVFGYKKSNNTNVNEIAYAPLNNEAPYVLPEDCVGIIGYIANVISEGNFVMEVKVEGVVDSIASLRDSASERVVFPYSAKIFKKIGGIGDSYMSGHIHLNGQEASIKNYDYSWGHYFSKLIGETFENYAQSGSTAKQWVDTTLFDRVKSCQAYMIALMINDQGDWSDYSTPVGTIDDIGTDANTYYAYYYKLIQKVVDVNPKAKIFCFICFVYSENFATMQLLEILLIIARIKDRMFIWWTQRSIRTINTLRILFLLKTVLMGIILLLVMSLWQSVIINLCLMLSTKMYMISKMYFRYLSNLE